MADAAGERPIIIKKIKKGGHGHHGGAWKVAYADFVTAMMAFFLLMWLLGATTEDQRKGIAEYFDPIAVSASQSGSGEILAGKAPTEEGSQVSDEQPSDIATSDRPGQQGNEPDPPTGEAEDLDAVNEEIPENPGMGQEGTSGSESGTGPTVAEMASQVADKAAEMAAERETAAKAAEESARFQETTAKIIQLIQGNPELSGLTKNLIVDETPEGLRIQIIDTDGTPMFESGSNRMSENFKKILALLLEAIKPIPNKLMIRGHTDAQQFRGGDKDNWDLSSERANASRREVIRMGLDPNRISSVVGRADQEPLLPDDPKNAQNRRIGIILLREFPKKEEKTN